MGHYLYNDGTIRVWEAKDSDFNFVLYLCKKFRNFEVFYVPDNSLRVEIRRGNILAFDYNVLEAGYIWVTFPRNGKSRINQIAVDPELWRNKVGTVVVDVYKDLADKRGMWSTYLSCNSNTPGHRFWPEIGWHNICQKKAGRRGGVNIIWGQLLPRHQTDFLFKPELSSIKSVESYKLQYSINPTKKTKGGEQK